MTTTRELFLTFYDEEYEKVHRHIFYSTGCNKEIADDLTSEVFLKAFEHLSQFREGSSMKTWMYTIVRNHIIDYYRARRVDVSLDAVSELQSSDDLERDIAVKEATELVLKALPKLPPRYRDIVTFSYIDELEPSEIAQVMNMPTSRVYVVLHRALRKLQSLTTQS